MGARPLQWFVVCGCILFAPLSYEHIVTSARDHNPKPVPHLHISLTFDDLPAHGPLPPGITRIEVVSKIIAALRAESVPPTFGFVNGSVIEKEAGGMQVLERWRDAGNPLGNHTWSHLNLNQHSEEEFEADIRKNESILRSLNDDWHWFRYPFLAEGDTATKRDAIRAYLAEHSYKIAAVTMSFDDYQWNEPYARCYARGDTRAIALLKQSYLRAADESIERYRAMSKAAVGRDIPYVLLLHIGAFDAEMLPALLGLYRNHGFSFVTLEEAESDAFYHGSTDPHLPFSPDSLEGAMGGQKTGSLIRRSDLPQFNELCR